MSQWLARTRYLTLRTTALALLSILLMVVGDHQPRILSPIRTTLSVLLAPINTVVALPIRLLHWFELGLSDQKHLIKENAELRARAMLLQEKLEKLQALQAENKQLKQLVAAETDLKTPAVTMAELLPVSPDPLNSQMLINQGRVDHVTLGQAVVDSYGVIGQVTHVGVFSSHVMLITARTSGVPVQDARSGVHAIVAGAGAGQPLSMIDVPDTEDVKVGDVLLTSGLGKVFPQGYPVAVITAVTQSPGQYFSTITATPKAHLMQSNEVLLVAPPAHAAHLGERNLVAVSQFSNAGQANKSSNKPS